MYHAHVHLDDDEETEAAQRLTEAQVRAQSGAVIVEIAPTRNHSRGQDQETGGRTTEEMTDIGGDLLQIILLMRNRATSALIFSGVATHTMTAV